MTDQPGFEHLADTLLSQGRISRFVRGEFAAPDGSRFERDIVRHLGAVAVVAIVEGALVLVRQYRAPLERFLYEIPAGLRDVPGEDPADTARRELIEEAGLRAGTMEHLVTMAPAPGLTDELVDIYLAGDLHEVDAEAHGVEEEWMTMSRLPLDEVAAMIRSGEIIDAKTIVAVHALSLR